VSYANSYDFFKVKTRKQKTKEAFFSDFFLYHQLALLSTDDLNFLQLKLFTWMGMI
jgi:hypothetical protein